MKSAQILKIHDLVLDTKKYHDDGQYIFDLRYLQLQNQKKRKGPPSELKKTPKNATKKHTPHTTPIKPPFRPGRFPEFPRTGGGAWCPLEWSQPIG